MQTLHPASTALIEDHIAWMVRRRLATETTSARRGHLVRALAWFGDHSTNLIDATGADIDAYQTHLMAMMIVSSERCVLSNLRQFYNWAVAEQRLSENPTRRLILPRAARRRPRPIREDRLILAYQQADPTMRAIICLAAMIGLRAVEIARLAWNDVDLDGELYATGKGGHQRAIWIADCDLLIEALKALPSRRGPVIPRLDGKPGHNLANTLDHRANNYLHDLGIEETLHQLRHRFGTVGYRAVQDPIAIMRLMGHADLSATVIYADASSENSRTAVAATGHLSSCS